MQAIFVDRQSSESRHAVVKEIRRRATEPGWPRWMVVIVMVTMISGC